MALFSMRVQVIGRGGSGRSIMAAVAYRAGERIHDERQDMVHDFSRRKDVEHKELLFPGDAPAWVQGIDREAFWNAVDAKEVRKDAQTAREIRLMIPRELGPQQRLSLVRGYVMHNFVERGMCADVAWHCKLSPTDGLPQPHAHILLTQRPLTADGFGPKVRHERVPDPSGATHPDGRPVMVSSNPASWNCSDYYERCREDWENRANAALAAIGSPERIDRRSYIERGLSRLSEPMLGVAYHMRTLYGAMKQRYGQWQLRHGDQPRIRGLENIRWQPRKLAPPRRWGIQVFARHGNPEHPVSGNSSHPRCCTIVPKGGFADTPP